MWIFMNTRAELARIKINIHTLTRTKDLQPSISWKIFSKNFSFLKHTPATVLVVRCICLCVLKITHTVNVFVRVWVGGCLYMRISAHGHTVPHDPSTYPIKRARCVRERGQQCFQEIESCVIDNCVIQQYVVVLCKRRSATSAHHKTPTSAPCERA